jgi:hemerythrin
MKRLIWTDNLNTGITVIDRQHGRIVDYINRLYDAQHAGEPKYTICTITEELVDYTLTHFAFEEAMLENIRFPSLRAHKETHEEFSKLVNNLRSRLQRSEEAAIELNNLMVTWLFNHILHEDARYVPAVLKSCGLKP